VGYPLPAHLWEAEVLPARVFGYATARLDFALGQSELRWQGNPGGAVRFLFERDLELIGPDSGPRNPEDTLDEEAQGAGVDARSAASSSEDSAPVPTRPPLGESPAKQPAGRGGARGGPVESEPAASSAAVASLFSDPHARYDFATLLNRAGGDIAALERRLWEGVWSGAVTNNTWSALRRGLQTKFRVGEVIERQTRSLEYAPRRASLRLSAWRESQAYPGSWFLLPEAPPAAGDDLVEREEVRKDRVRLLLDRYGILFRELLAREATPFRWPDVFRSLRLMELSGEVLAGYFFRGIPGPQFMSHAALRVFLRGAPAEPVFWLSAVDPASACGLPLNGLRGELPKRVEGTHLVYRRTRLALVSQRNGRSLQLNLAPDDEGVLECLGLFRHLLGRDYAPLRRVVIETINGEPAPASPYLPAFRQLFETVVDIKRVSLFRHLER
jgi:ATP-dependent Lhr-like helicase